MYGTTTRPTPVEVRKALDRILASAEFRTSKRCREFLRFVVEQSLDAGQPPVKERTIGAAVFGRDPAYDTHDDAIVRVKANEIRKKLAVYYLGEGTSDSLRVAIPAGSYIAEFSAPTEAPQPPAATPIIQRRRSLPRWTYGVALLPLVAAGILLGFRHSGNTTLDRFWAPALESSRPVVICVGHPVVYLLSRRVHEAYQATRRIDPRLGPYVIQLEPDEPIPGRDIVPVTDQFVGAGDAKACASLFAFFTSRRKPSEIRFGNDTSFGDLRSAPAVLIGAFSNRWTMEMMNELRFVFDYENGAKRIRDRALPDRSWPLPAIAPDGKTAEDYVLVSRVFDSKTGELLIAAGGITQYGTQTAGEFLTSEVRLREALANAPSDWQKKNFQAVLHTSIIGQSPGPPKVVTVHFW